jgi:hypothetical protein
MVAIITYSQHSDEVIDSRLEMLGMLFPLDDDDEPVRSVRLPNVGGDGVAQLLLRTQLVVTRLGSYLTEQCQQNIFLDSVSNTELMIHYAISNLLT